MLGLASKASSILSGTQFEAVGQQVVTLIVVSTFLAEVFGTYGARFAIKRADEVGKSQ